MSPARWALALALLAACTGNGEFQPPAVTPSTPAASGDPAEVRTGPTTAMEAMRRLCMRPNVETDPVTRSPTPPTIREVESQVEAVRGLRFERDVNVEPISPAEIDRRIGRYLEDYYPERFYSRRSAVWATIGAIPGDVDILEALGRYQQGQVLGFYNSQNEELVYTGDADLSRIEQFILAHELTHAIDDQHFDLDRIDGLAARCDDERFLAALGVVEGSANHFATQVVIRYPVSDVGDVSGGSTEGVPPMILDLQLYPYTDGQTFVDALADEGGSEAVDRALTSFPITTEQILHPSRFPDDRPEMVDVPDFAPTFGDRWRDLDVMQVGELWLRVLLDLGLEEDAAERAATGWDGGIYRAWTDGEEVAVVLSTVWDTPEDAAEFADALSRWAERGESVGPVVLAAGTRVHAAFASSEQLLPDVSSTLRSI